MQLIFIKLTVNSVEACEYIQILAGGSESASVSESNKSRRIDAMGGHLLSLSLLHSQLPLDPFLHPVRRVDISAKPGTLLAFVA